MRLQSIGGFEGNKRRRPKGRRRRGTHQADVPGLHELIGERAPELTTRDTVPVEREQPDELSGVLILEHEKSDVQE